MASPNAVAVARWRKHRDRPKPMLQRITSFTQSVNARETFVAVKDGMRVTAQNPTSNAPNFNSARVSGARNQKIVSTAVRAAMPKRIVIVIAAGPAKYRGQ